jgi:RNA polymerase sigma-70 factor, ECF subfamily
VGTEETVRAVTPTDENLLVAAKRGDQDAYTRLVAPHRAELHAHCYRMLGSVSDAEDALQEALLRAWRGMGSFEGRSSLRTWLYSITTNACLKLIERRPKRILPVDYGPAADPHDLELPEVEAGWIEPYPAAELGYEQLESVELAFVAALQHLTPAQRAVLILRDVLGFSAGETADLLGTTATSVYSSLQRAHKTVDARLGGPSQQATLREIGDEALAGIVSTYVDAWQRGDVGTIVGLLTEDATFSMPPIASWFRGRAAIGAFLAAHPLSPEKTWRVIQTSANGQPALGTYLLDTSTGSYVGHGVEVLTLRADGGRGAAVSALTGFLHRDLLPAFGLPLYLPPG